MTQSTIQGCVVRRFTAPAESVFDAWLDPAKARRFLLAAAPFEDVSLLMEARVGGRILVVEGRPGGDVEHAGEYLDIERPHRLVFSLFPAVQGPASDRVRVEITPLPIGCELLLTVETSGESVAVRDRLEEEWAEVLVELDATLA